eukprot:12540736-Alexandrium_andersonii.AAC.1
MLWSLPVWSELFEAMVLLPLSQLQLSAGWAPTVQCSDAAGSGCHGLAYAYVDKATQQRWARQATFRGSYVNLQFDLDLVPDDKCPL